MSEIQTTDWSETASANNQAPPNGWPEGQAPSTVNDCARAMMAAVKRDWNRTHPTVTSGGTTSALTLTYANAPTMADGLAFTFRLGTDIGPAAKLAINGGTALDLYFRGAAVVDDLFLAGDIVTVYYNVGATRLDLQGSAREVSAPWWSPTGIKTANYTAVNAELVLVNTSGGVVTIKVPATPATGARVAVWDVGRATLTNPITIDRNGSTIDGAASSIQIGRPGRIVMLYYTGSTWASDLTRHVDVVQAACSNLVNALTTGTNKAFWDWPFSGQVLTFTGSLLTASSSGALTIDINKNGTTMMSSTKLTINASATSSASATQPVLTTTAVAAGDRATVDLDAAGTGAKGLQVTAYLLRD